MKKFFIAILIVCVAIAFFDSCNNSCWKKDTTVPGKQKPTTLNVRYWKVADGDFKYPEIHDKELKYTPILNRPSCGICISGGGTVSASLSTGYFKALKDLDLMKNLRYIAGVSGGTWGSAPYCFLPADIPDDRFLGPKYPPEKLTETILNKPPNPQSMTAAVTNAEIICLTLKNLLKYGHEAYTRAVGEIFLKPFGIDYSTKYFTTDKYAAQKIIARNTELSLDDFVTLRQDRPYLVMNGTIFVPNPMVCSKYTVYPFEFTPLYSGLKAVESVKGSYDQVIGGFFVESFGFDTTLKSVDSKKRSATVTPGKYPFTLCEPVGTSGEAVESAAVELGPIGTWPFPQFKYWNPSDSDLPKTPTYNFGDGGLIEDTGVVSLLRRKVANIAVFLTEPFDTNPKSNEPKDMEERYYGYNQVASLFGQPIYNTKKGCCYGKLIRDPIDRTVFDPSQFEELKNGLQKAKKNGGPIYVYGKYKVVTNRMFGVDVEGYSHCNIIWMCVDTCTNFNKKLPDPVKKKIGKPGELQDFPVVKVFDQNIGHIIQLTRPQAYLLENFAYWMVFGDPKPDKPLPPQAQAFKKLLGGKSH